MGVETDVRLAAAGDTTAFERLYRAHVPRVYGLACRMAGYDRADEFTQDVFVRTWQKLRTFRGEATFSSWLYRLAANLICSQLRADGTRREHETTIGVMPAGRSVEQESAETRLDLEAAMQRLPDRARQIFVLHDVEGYKHREIAKIMGIKLGTSKSQLHRARMMLRQYMAPDAT